MGNVNIIGAEGAGDIFKTYVLAGCGLCRADQRQGGCFQPDMADVQRALGRGNLNTLQVCVAAQQV